MHRESLMVANLLGSWDVRSPADMLVVQRLAPVSMEQWTRDVSEALHEPQCTLQSAGGVWTVTERRELWSSLAPRLFDATLDDFESAAISVLQEPDPQFDLDRKDRFAAPIYGKVLQHSHALRVGIVDTLALLGTETAPLPNCGADRGKRSAHTVVRNVLQGGTWKRWAGLNTLLPTMAEAAPDAFLSAVEAAISTSPSPFDEMFAQEGPAMAGSNYTTGLLWALESLAWDEQCLVSASMALANLAARDPGGAWANRPANSLAMIFLPWRPQTRASSDKRLAALESILREQREVGWKLLQSLMPGRNRTSTPTHRPRWRNPVGDTDIQRPTASDYAAQVNAIARLAEVVIRTDSSKLTDWLSRIDALPEDSFNDALLIAGDDSTRRLPEEERTKIWETLSAVARKHRSHSDAEWAMPEGELTKVEEAARILAPTDPQFVHRYLFGKDAYRLLDDLHARFDEQRLTAVSNVHTRHGLTGLLRFAEAVHDAFGVGFASGTLEGITLSNDQLATLVSSESSKLKNFTQGYVRGRLQRESWGWLDSIQFSQWSISQVATLLTYLPFDQPTWDRANAWLGNHADDYWTRVPVRPFEISDNPGFAIDALLRVGRPFAAIQCFVRALHDKKTIHADQALRTLTQAANSKEPSGAIDAHDTAMVIKAVQDAASVDRQKLIQVEWAFLALLTQSPITKPTTLYAELANNPELFCQVVRTVFRSRKEVEEDRDEEDSESRKAAALNAYHLLEEWSTVPGVDARGNVDISAVNRWFDEARRSLEQSGHLDVGLQKAGEVLIHAPADPSGLFIHHAIAEVLNREDMEQLRRGYQLAELNSRGVHVVDPSGDQERQLARKYADRAGAAKNAGYPLLAATLRELESDYLRQAERYRKEGEGDSAALGQ